MVYPRDNRVERTAQYPDLLVTAFFCTVNRKRRAGEYTGEVSTSERGVPNSYRTPGQGPSFVPRSPGTSPIVSPERRRRRLANAVSPTIGLGLSNAPVAGSQTDGGRNAGPLLNAGTDQNAGVVDTGGRVFWSTQEKTRLKYEYDRLRERRRRDKVRNPTVDKAMEILWEDLRLKIEDRYGVTLPQRSASSLKNQYPKVILRGLPDSGLPWAGVQVNDTGQVVVVDHAEAATLRGSSPAAVDGEAEEPVVPPLPAAEVVESAADAAVPDPQSEIVADQGVETRPVENPPANSRETETEPVEVEPYLEGQYKFFVSKILGKSMWRKPIKYPRRVPETLWRQANELIERSIRQGEVSIQSLNCMVYAAGCAVKSSLDKKDQEAKRRESEWYACRKAEIKALERYLNFIDLELKRRSASRPLTSRQRQNLGVLITKYGRARVRSGVRLSELQAMLRDALVGIRKCMAKRSADKKRKQGKFVPIQRYLEPSSAEPRLSPDTVRAYWNDIVGSSQQSTSDSTIQDWSSNLSVPSQELNASKIMGWWRAAVSKSKPNKAAGPDGIPGVLWKRFRSASEWVCTWLYRLLQKRRIITPRWLSVGRVVLLPKKGPLEDPANYRPIACLNTVYKLITSVVEMAVREQIQACPGLVPYEQIANRKGVWGCTHASIVDRMITGASREGKGGGFPDLRVLFYDCKKAFDSVNRDHMFAVLRVANVNVKVVHLLHTLSQQWCVRYELRRNNRVERSSPLRVKRGLLQGDTLSPTWFCLCMAPISASIKTLNPGPTLRPNMGNGRNRGQVAIQVSHVFYMDDLKVYCPRVADQRRMEQNIPQLFGEIGLSINASKSAAAAAVGRYVESELPVLGTKDEYKYLGIESGFVVNEVAALDRMQAVLLNRVEAILSVKEHTVGQRRDAIRAKAIPGGAYILGHIILSDLDPRGAAERMRRLDIEIRRLVKSAGILHDKCSTARIHLSCEQGGLAWPSMERAYYVAVAYSASYLLTSQDETISRARDYFVSGRLSNKFTVYKHLTSIVDSLGLSVELPDPNGLPTGQPSVLARTIARAIDAKLEAQWKETLLTYQRAGRVERADPTVVDHANSYHWLRKAWINEKAYQHAVSVMEGTLLEGVNPHGVLTMCRACKAPSASIAHIITGCAELRKSHMKVRHDGVTRWLYNALTEVDGSLPKFHYTQQIPAEMRGERLTVRYDSDIVTPNKPRHNRPDLVVFDSTRKVIYIVEVSVTWLSVLQKQYDNKLNRYAVNSNHEFSESIPYPPGVNLANEIRVLYPQFTGGVKDALGGRHGDAYEWINEIPTVPNYYLAKPQPRERAWQRQRGKKTLLSLTLV
uniref:Reverse transcriptase domain-containing protein n=1 Tax=Bursaphelenchus xylophilus TaxID=6326 RepID=A0A1I7S6I4_BURXY